MPKSKSPKTANPSNLTNLPAIRLSSSALSSLPKGSSSKTGKAGASMGAPSSMEELLAATGYNIPTLRRGQEVSGKLIAISHQEVLIDIGAKSEGIVFGRELASVRDITAKLSVGDQVNAVVLYPENEAGQVVLSLRKHSGEQRWSELENKRVSAENIEVVAIETNRGGIICDWMGLRGFLPASQLIEPPTKLGDLIGRNLSAHVIEVDRTTNRLIFSQKGLEKRDIKELAALLAKVKIGQKYSGVVSAVLPFGVFVEIEVGGAGPVSSGSPPPQSVPDKAGISSLAGSPLAATRKGIASISKLEGLVHISEISWEKIEDPTKLFKVGDEAEVMVIAKEEATGRLNLSIKQLAQDPFLEVSSKYSKDQEVRGTVSKITSYGVFITLEGGIEGLVHVSKIPPGEPWQVGEGVNCIVDSIDTKARRISLVPVSKEKPILYR